MTAQLCLLCHQLDRALGCIPADMLIEREMKVLVCQWVMCWLRDGKLPGYITSSWDKAMATVHIPDCLAAEAGPLP